MHNYFNIYILRVYVGWVEHLFAKPIILHKADGFHYMPKKQAFHSTHPTEMLKYLLDT